MVLAKVRGSPDEGILAKPELVAASGFPPSGAVHTSPRVFGTPSGYEGVVLGREPLGHMAPGAAERDDHRTRVRKPVGEVRTIGAGGDRRVGEVKEQGARESDGCKIVLHA